MGVPLVMLPQGANQFDNAVRCERGRRGADVWRRSDATAASIAAALGAVLADASYREGCAPDRRPRSRRWRPADEVAAAVEEHVARR